MKPYHWLLTTMALLLGGCKIPHGPIQLRFLYYPQNPSVCSPGVLVKGRLPEDFWRSSYFAAVWLAPNGETGTLPVPIEGAQTPNVRFRLTDSATVPTRDEALANLPSPQTWKNHYVLVYLIGDVMPEISLQCSETSTPVVLPAANDLPTHAVVVIEDSNSPGSLKVVKQPYAK